MPATTIKEVIERMDELLARWEAHGDYHAIFVRSYRIITIAMEQAIAAGEFEDPDWMTRLDIVFAEEYFTAVGAYEQDHERLPECWKRVFDIASRKRSTTLQDLMLGMVAHIVHDLPIALYKVGVEAEYRESRLRDHQTANEILGRSIDDVQSEISSHYSFILGFLDRLFGNKDEILTDQGVRIARDLAWKRAVELSEAPTQAVRDSLLDQIGQTALTDVKLLTPKPPTLLAKLIPLLRHWDKIIARQIRRIKSFFS
ncbi:MAG: DUF5995 family protein [Candidatus Thiodiazotropha lotti]|nr:DUF5995 family protein [Candidatus Thiodiazotropha lotti]MCG8005218.1 DUF5995 family protein [Candidatus Thiodiazotropha lotti]MCG8006947.1 DUF5995 family protein [Candidatus Thiodiazotropha lotti]MCW4188845.1 DUF5995 family protein [Candidatus Thiodiazotropha lotti]MCW4194529.1 DUF5995 family protein [Candidatus Thiodiazotropha lotti]